MHTIAIEWLTGRPQGTVEVFNGELAVLSAVRGQGMATAQRFAFTADGPCRLEVTVKDEDLSHGDAPTMVTVRTTEHPFTVLLRDVHCDYPIYIPAYGVAVTTVDDQRTCAQIQEAIAARGLRTVLQTIANEPEESFPVAAAATRQ